MLEQQPAEPSFVPHGRLFKFERCAQTTPNVCCTFTSQPPPPQRRNGQEEVARAVIQDVSGSGHCGRDAGGRVAGQVHDSVGQEAGLPCAAGPLSPLPITNPQPLTMSPAAVLRGPVASAAGCAGVDPQGRAAALQVSKP